MTEPLSIFTAPPRSEQTAAISADLLAAYVEAFRVLESYYIRPSPKTWVNVKVVHERVRELSGTHCETDHV